MWRWTVSLLSLLGVLLLVATGCGDDDEDDDSDTGGVTQASGGETVNVSLTDFAIDMPDKVAAGPVTFAVTNNGAVAHNFEVEGQGVEEELQANLQPGESATLSVTLTSGEYTIYCPVSGHREAGMTKQVTVP